MQSSNTLKENIQWLLKRYQEEKKYEEAKDNPDNIIIGLYDNYIIELEWALKISK